MFKKIVNSFNNLDSLAKIIMKNGLRFCFGLTIVSILILISYNLFFHSPFIFSIGLTIFRLSLIFGSEFIICGFAADKIKKQIS